MIKLITSLLIAFNFVSCININEDYKTPKKIVIVGRINKVDTNNLSINLSVNRLGFEKEDFVEETEIAGAAAFLAYAAEADVNMFV